MNTDAAVAAVQGAPDLECSGGCKAAFQVTTGYDWTGDGNNIPPSPVGGVASAQGCQAKCFAITTCLTFTYNGGVDHLSNGLAQDSSQKDVSTLKITMSIIRKPCMLQI